MEPTYFFDDELSLEKPEPGITAERLLRREAIFFLKDLVKPLGLDRLEIKRQVAKLEAEGKSAWETMGVRKVWDRWLVRMKVFAPYYRRHLIKDWRPIPSDWDGNRLLNERGVFKLAEVARKLPVNCEQLRHQAKVLAGARTVLGIWKDPVSGQFFVDMDIFSPWFRNLWDNHD